MILPLIAAISLALVFLVETLAWFLRANALTEGRAYVISKSNLILYSSRGFAFGFQASISYYLETSGKVDGIFFVCVVGFVSSAVLHAVAFYHSPSRNFMWSGMVLFMKKINRWDDRLMGEGLAQIQRISSRRLFFATSISTSIFGLAITLPYLLALYNPELRLTFTSFIQLLNFFGTIFLLYLVDPIMYKLMDDGRLRFSIYDYIAGRVVGFLVSLGVTITVIFLLR
jgi:hypothetical protein